MELSDIYRIETWKECEVTKSEQNSNTETFIGHNYPPVVYYCEKFQQYVIWHLLNVGKYKDLQYSLLFSNMV